MQAFRSHHQHFGDELIKAVIDQHVGDFITNFGDGLIPCHSQCSGNESMSDWRRILPTEDFIAPGYMSRKARMFITDKFDICKFGNKSVCGLRRLQFQWFTVCGLRC